MATQYSLTIINNSPQSGDFCLYQVDANVKDPYIMSLAWLSKRAHPSTTLQYAWVIDYSFVWAETGNLQPGIIFKASQNVNGGLTQDNAITFTKEDGAYHFIDLTTDENYDGLLNIKCDNTIPTQQASVGIGMSGSPTFVRQAQPNMAFIFSPKIEYRLAFGYYDQGEVLNLGQISNFATIEFPNGVYSMTAILNADNTWTVEPS